MKSAILFTLTLLAFTACNPKVEGDKTTERTEAMEAMDSTTLSGDSLPADNTQALDTADRSEKAE